MPQRPTQGFRLLLGTDAITPVFAEVAYVTNWNGPGGTKAKVQSTHLRSAAHEYISGLPQPGDFTFDCWFDPAQATHDELRTLASTDDTRIWRAVYVAGIAANADEFTASVESFVPAGGVDGVLGAAVTLSITGAVDIVDDTTP